MSLPYDAVLKVLVETEPQAWLPVLGLTPARTTAIDADISTTIAGGADKVLYVHSKPKYLLHLDFQSGHDSAALPRRLRLYNTVLDDRHEILVRSVAVILRPEADSPQLTGLLERGFPGELPYATWRYGVLRLWQLPVSTFLTGGVGLLPLAPVSHVSRQELPGVIEQMKDRLRDDKRADELWTATRVLLGLRYSREIAKILMQGVMGMKESVTYQEIVREGRVEEARRMLVIMGEQSLGTADNEVHRLLDSIDSVKRLEHLAKNVRNVSTWQELLRSERPKPRNGRRRSS
jgi:predicted transposase YdaD